MPRLCVLTQYYPPEMGAPQARLHELAIRLAKIGWSVEALTALPNYPAGRVHDDYSSVRPVVETIDGIRTARVPLYASKQGGARRLACYVSFAFAAAAFGPRLVSRPDVIYVESPPLFIGLAARTLALWFRCPYVLNVSDLWPQSLVEARLVEPGLAVTLAERFEESLYRNAAAVTGQTDEICAHVRRSIPSTRVELITNGVDASRFGAHRADDDARRLVGDEPGPVFVFAGLFGHAQGLDQILDLARDLPPEAAGRFVLVGDGPVRESLEQRVARDGVARVRIVPAQPRDRIPAILACADATIITLGMRLEGAVPSKIYEAMAASLPILLVADGEPARRVLDAGAGVAVPPSRPEELKTAFDLLANDAALRGEMGAAGRRAAETIYSRDAIARKLDSLLVDSLRDDP